jgi:transposase InsO family protein
MTSVRVPEHGSCHLNAAIDCCTREIVGWALDVPCNAAGRPLSWTTRSSLAAGR